MKIESIPLHVMQPLIKEEFCNFRDINRRKYWDILIGNETMIGNVVNIDLLAEEDIPVWAAPAIEQHATPRVAKDVIVDGDLYWIDVVGGIVKDRKGRYMFREGDMLYMVIMPGSASIDNRLKPYLNTNLSWRDVFMLEIL